MKEFGLKSILKQVLKLKENVKMENLSLMFLVTSS